MMIKMNSDTWINFLQFISLLFQALSQDKESLMKLKKSVKDIQQSGTSKCKTNLAKTTGCEISYKCFWQMYWEYIRCFDGTSTSVTILCFQTMLTLKWSCQKLSTRWGTWPSLVKMRKMISGRLFRNSLSLQRSCPHWWEIW